MVLTQIRPHKISGLTWIQTAQHSYGIPEIFFLKDDFEKFSRQRDVYEQLTSMKIVISIYCKVNLRLIVVA